MIEHSIWNERHRPPSLDEFIALPETKEKFKKYIKENDIPHLIFAGQAGSGKTTMAKILSKNIECDSLYINASDENGIDVIRDKVKAFASAASFKPLKLVILDEADYLTVNAQAILRNIIETYSRSTRFIFTCNYIEKLIDPLQSRCVVYKLEPPKKEEIAEFVTNILDKENIKYNLKDVAKVISKFYPDIRKTINYLQDASTDGTLKDISTKITNDWKNEIISLLKKPTKDSWTKIREVIVNNDIRDFQELYRELYEVNFNNPEITIVIAESLYKQAFVVDKEINFCACIAKIIELLKSDKLIKG